MAILPNSASGEDMFYFKKSKKIVLLLLVMLCMMLFSACSPIRLTTKYEDSGKVEVTLTLPTSSLKALGESSYSIRVDRVYTILTHYMQDVKTACEDKTLELFSHIYSFPPTMSREEKLSEIYLTNRKFTFDTEVTPSRSAYDYSSTTQEITITCTFSSIYAYIMYFYPDAFKYNEEENNLVIDKDKTSLLSDVPVASSTLKMEDAFLWKTYTQIASPLLYNGGECALLSPLNVGLKSYPAGELISNVVKDALSLSSEEASFVFSFLSPYRRLGSNGTISYNDGYYVHTWELDDTSSQVKFSRRIANYSSWYISAAILGAVLMCGMIVSYFIQKKKNSKYRKNVANSILSDQSVKITEKPTEETDK